MTWAYLNAATTSQPHAALDSSGHGLVESFANFFRCESEFSFDDPTCAVIVTSATKLEYVHCLGPIEETFSLVE
jgi:hypothetical protein